MLSMIVNQMTWIVENSRNGMLRSRFGCYNETKEWHVLCCCTDALRRKNVGSDLNAKAL